MRHPASIYSIMGGLLLSVFPFVIVWGWMQLFPSMQNNPQPGRHPYISGTGLKAWPQSVSENHCSYLAGSYYPTDARLLGMGSGKTLIDTSFSPPLLFPAYDGKSEPVLKEIITTKKYKYIFFSSGGDDSVHTERIEALPFPGSQGHCPHCNQESHFSPDKDSLNLPAIPKP